MLFTPCERKKACFFEKKQEKVLWVNKKALPLHPQSREMLLQRG